jgi:leucine dehydrogenase
MPASDLSIDPIPTDTDHEQVLRARDPSIGYTGIIAIHSTRLGPAVGGTRFWSYPGEQEAVTDALRLSRGMTYKTAISGIPLGGGKSVIMANPEAADRTALFRAHGRFVEHLGGRYITAEDVGTGVDDMEVVRMETRYVGGFRGGMGDPSPFTARGVVRAIQAAARFRWGSADLTGRTIAIQGCGNVGSQLAAQLHQLGASLVVSDVDTARARRVAAATDAAIAPPDQIWYVAADIFAPAALGGILNPDTVPLLRASIVAGAANNQLSRPEDGAALAGRDILYVPDYLANAGGVLSGCHDILGWSVEEVQQRIDAIYDAALEILGRARREGVRPEVAADGLVEERLAKAK